MSEREYQVRLALLAVLILTLGLSSAALCSALGAAPPDDDCAVRSAGRALESVDGCLGGPDRWLLERGRGS